ncbi:MULTISPECIES: hypothetical protein [Brevibacillus]|jgi:hypothetical protein|uniref:hypothetical protein n=1 Tax=Brevibacillus TaxID=55080 RepID=UPI000F076613|nr:hypothetical protein [Brevibacillus borstelensis]MED1745725.1 hypothetical protein [Brevibacillus borstelensis]MED1883072.1 hypothetical protein [Brevibacillus borstelensis]MED2008677.1 hypothetical protein [Brevibacillus borstelensis]RNB55932.1 hypothetical protein EDM54_24490 [Brevibacillus borstelensis]GED54918.1 hypothetical protein BBO01nite_41590 [Brevibacillus borstelensis]
MPVTNGRISLDPAAPDSLMSGAGKINRNFDLIDSEFANVQANIFSLNTRAVHDERNIVDLAIELETLKGATLNNVNANIYIETFREISDIRLWSGVFDSTAKRVVLK